jgi:hypothetical protein
MMTATPALDHLDAQQLRELATRLMAVMQRKWTLRMDRRTPKIDPTWPFWVTD